MTTTALSDFSPSVLRPTSHQMSKRPAMPAQRRRMILEILRQQGSVTVDEVQEQFGVSPMTARRDLALLARRGQARRTHGGAVLPELAAHEDSFDSRVGQDVEAKQRLARAVANTIMPGETIFVDSSSSGYYAARELVTAGLAITLITNALPVMALLCDAQDTPVELIGLSGRFRRANQSFVDPQTVRAIERFSADRVIFSVKGIAPDGSLTEPDPQEATVKRAMIHRARKAILVAAGEKFSERGANVIAPAATVDTAYLVDPPQAGVERLEAAGVTITRV